ncbi:MAG: rod shape-determining protein MreD [Oscillospiraceae bacterium]|nr:rod shape-determining protein MreD [Oscillospiraceae bacterium]
MTRQDWLYKWFSYGLALIPVWWLDAYVLSRFPVLGVTALLLPVAVAAVGVLEGASGGAGFGLAAGLLWACAYSGGHGGRVLLLAVMGVLTGVLAQYALAQTLLGCVLCSAVALAVIELLEILPEIFFMRAQLLPLLNIALPQLIWTLCWVPMVYALFYRVFVRVGGDRLA